MNVHWQYVLKHLAWYVGVVALLAIVVFVFRVRSLYLLPWLVAIGWGIALIFILRQTGEEPDTEERLQNYLDQAGAYKAQIDAVIQTGSNRSDAVSLSRLVNQVDTWTQAIENLVQRINMLRQDALIRQDMKAVPRAIEKLETRLASETEPTIQAQLERTLANRRKQLASLEQLQTVIARAEIQIESTLSMLGTIYSQILTGQSTSHVADYSRLSTDVDEEVRVLQDHLEALREVKLGGE